MSRTGIDCHSTEASTAGNVIKFSRKLWFECRFGENVARTTGSDCAIFRRQFYERNCSFSGDDRNFNGQSYISAGDAANGTSLHAFNGLPTYLPTYLRTYISLIAPRPASIAPICITRTYIHTYRSFRFVALVISLVATPLSLSLRFLLLFTGSAIPSGLFSRTREGGKYARRLSFSPPPT